MRCLAQAWLQVLGMGDALRDAEWIFCSCLRSSAYFTGIFEFCFIAPLWCAIISTRQEGSLGQRQMDLFAGRTASWPPAVLLCWFPVLSQRTFLPQTCWVFFQLPFPALGQDEITWIGETSRLQSLSEGLGPGCTCGALWREPVSTSGPYFIFISCFHFKLVHK